ncbi:phosphoribosyltransferase domain-containing protein [Actinomadura alba]|uniref:Phosphoribosyltransferase domain-containing protein n=1 Tax=Actinomadura alba TaxID=406431 RepID=A0ABR7LGE9_9ACTN|nr:phosphoribosyltransferase domain-containing protein [Actinomadura alba]
MNDAWDDARNDWAGTWVARRLDVALRDLDRPVGAGLAELLGLAVRRNPRRAHLLVSTVLGKHVPTDPRLVRGAGLLLGELVRVALSGAERVHGRPETDHAELFGGPLTEALKGRTDAAAALRDRLEATGPPLPAVVIGYAETATALGHCVADALGGAYYLHSTRRPVPGMPPYGAFEEEHSHATSHLLLPADLDLMDADLPVVLVDDEISTGTTVLNTIRALHAVRPRRHYVVASLVDMRRPADRAATDALAAALGARIETVALAIGEVVLPDDVLGAAARLVAAAHDAGAGDPSAATPSAATPSEPSGSPGGRVRRVELGWPTGLPDGGRHGFTPHDRARLDAALPAMAERLSAALTGGAAPMPTRVLVLGFEELMYAPLRLAEALADRLEATEVRYSTTTRSPVLAVDDPGYAIRTRLAFPAHDDPADGPGERYAYNVAAGTDPGRRFDAILLVVDDRADTAELADGLLARLTGLGAAVLLAVVPAGRPVPAGARRVGDPVRVEEGEER